MSFFHTLKCFKLKKWTLTFNKKFVIFEEGALLVGDGVIALLCNVPVLRVAPEPTAKMKKKIKFY